MPETAEKQSGSPVEQALEQIGPADIVLGIPTHNHRETVALAAQAGIGALRDRFPGIRAAIVNADGNSQDGTPDYLRQTLGDDVFEHYLHFFKTEQSLFDNAVTTWERARYFEQI